MNNREINIQSIPKLFRAMANSENAKQSKLDIVYIEAAKLIEEKEIKVFNPLKDEMVLVTQEWCDQTQLQNSFMHKQREAIEKISKFRLLHDHKKLMQIKDILDA